MTGAQVRGDMDAVMDYMMDFYFESAAMILTLITVGKMLEARSKGKTTDALKSLMKLAPKTATVVRNGEEETVPIEQVQSGRHLRRPPRREHPGRRRGAERHKRGQRSGAYRREHPGRQGRRRYRFCRDRQPVGLSRPASATRVGRGHDALADHPAWSATRRPPRRRSPRSRTRSPAFLSRRSSRSHL